MKRFTQLAGLLSPKIILFAVSIIIVIHLITLSFYTEEHELAKEQVIRSTQIHKVLNIIHIAKTALPAELNHALEAINDSDVTIRLTDHPTYKLQTAQTSYWDINHLFPQEANDIKISIKLQENRWINIHARASNSVFDQLILIMLEVIVAIVVLFYAWSINRFVRPLNDFRLAAEKLGVDINSELGFAEKYQGPDIIAETADAMAKMQKRIQDLINDRTHLLAAISHDLRTPLTRLKLRLSLLENPELVEKNLNDIDEMQQMISEILDFARGVDINEPEIKVDLNSMLQTICDEMIDVGKPVSYESYHCRVPYMLRPLSFKRAITNLIGNAIKYGNVAKVQLAVNKQTISITICDEGPGIVPAEIDLVFKPFYRCDHSRSRAIGGTGLGLTIVHDTIVAHHGNIKLINLPEGGLCATIILPKDLPSTSP